MKNPAYVLGHSDFELERLARPERLIGKITLEYFKSAGIGPGMRVLDVGSGTGAVAFHAAELVGRSGEVIGTDRAPEAVATASKNAVAFGLPHVHFRHGNPVEMCAPIRLRPSTIAVVRGFPTLSHPSARVPI